jgi:predicted nucleic acid-binding protein
VSEHLIIDPSVLIQAYVQEPHTALVQALLDRLKQPDNLTLHVPEFCLLECANILWRHVRFSGMPRSTAITAVTNLTNLPLTIHAAKDYLSEALIIGLDSELAIYDSVYIAQAKALTFPLLTGDVKQAKAAINAGVTVKQITDYPLPNP